MKTQIEKVTSTDERENNEVISRVMAKIDGLTRLDEAFNEVKEVIEKLAWFKCGKGGSHIWVSNWNNERLILITETRKN